MSSSSLPWHQLNTLLVRIGEASDFDSFWNAVLQELEVAVPFEAAQVVFRDRCSGLF